MQVAETGMLTAPAMEIQVEQRRKVCLLTLRNLEEHATPKPIQDVQCT